MMELTELQEKWLQALESGEYQQAQGILSEYENEEGFKRYCCLGVGCELLIKAGLIDGFDSGGIFPDPTPAKMIGWIDNGNDPNLKLEGYKYPREFGVSRLAELNDEENLTFPQIAAEVRAHPEKYFVPAESDNSQD